MEILKEILACMILLTSGILMLVKPDAVWKIEHHFAVQKGEPTDWYLAIVRIMGLVFIVIAVIAAFVFLVF